MCEDILITHTDLDGLGCEVVAKEVFPEIDVRRTDYDTVNATIEEALLDAPDLLIISDIWLEGSPKHVLKELRRFRGQLLIFDHHYTVAEEQDSLRDKHEIINQTGISATKQMADFFDVKLPSVELVNEYDTTGTLTGDAGDLNTLFWKRKRWYMTQVLQRKPFFFTESDRAIIDETNQKKENYFQNILQHADILEYNGHSLAYVEGTEYLGYCLNRLLDDYEYAIMNNVEAQKVSLRSTGELAGEIASRCGGGGHAKAAGISRLCDKNELLTTAKEVLNEAERSI